MTLLPSMPKTFLACLKLAIRYHFSVMRKIVVPIVFLVIIKDVPFYFSNIPTISYWNDLITLIIGLLATYLIATMLYIADRVLEHQTTDWQSAFVIMIPRMAKVVAIAVIFILLILLSVAVMKWLINAMPTTGQQANSYAGLIIVLSIGLPVMLFFLYYFYAIPDVIIDNFSLRQALVDAPMLIGDQFRHLLRIFGVYSCSFTIWLLVSPDTLHGHLMRMYRLSPLFDFIAFTVTLPIVINLTILVRHDLRLRRSISKS